MPNVLLASERHHVHFALKRTGLATGPLEGNLNLVRVLPVFVNQQQRPVAIGASNRIAGDKRVTRRIMDGAVHTEQVMHPGTMRDPLVVDHAASVILGGELANFEIGVGHVIPISRPATVTSGRSGSA